MPAAKRVSTLARVSIWLGVLTCVVGLVTTSEFYALKARGLTGEIITDSIAAMLGIITVVLGHLARREIRLSNPPMKGKVLAIIGLIFGYLNIVFFLVDILVTATG
jgi:hypothetical protein